MANHSSAELQDEIPLELEGTVEAVDEFDFDDEEDDFMERSQRKLLQSKRGRVSRRQTEWA